MKVPFFRSKATAKKAADDSDAEKLKRSLVSSASMSTIPRINNMAEMDRFLLTIDTFQTEARKLFPENAALDQILDELRTECRRRLDYMTRVSTPSWVAQRPSSSSTINVASSQLRVRAKTVNESPLSTTTMASNTSDESSSSSDISISANKLRSQVGSNGAATAQTVRGGQSTQAGRRDARLAENRRRNMPQSMFVSNVSADLPKPNNANRSSVHQSMAKLPRTSMLLDTPPSRNSTIDFLSLPANKADNNTGLQPKPSFVKPKEYVIVIAIAGHKIEAAVSFSLQTSLISMQLAQLMGMPIVSVAPTRVWDNLAKKNSWVVVGEVTGLPFVCGKMTFTHSFKVVQNNSGEMRDVVLGNDFCIGNKGRIKDNLLYLEQLCMPVSVPIKQISA
ncbi:hypothetical protein GGI25_003048 [Coemansia spiralis]|uniref:Uncharacterized protein n=2 Tax=Coemansia TaxID=4863 RepID=A0A9W8KYT6_9FUNG|nr:hypothetical protein EDC05_002955 [Coemansia umbellata]KAJ2622053.1 hypothetical protein GGI26_003629 [Coemansia sp. RSA 1358]KAJ2677658.1 hypothetical protein GGI25_003048 [Coemansia spiralis]